jgi:heat shock protein HslJ
VKKARVLAGALVMIALLLVGGCTAAPKTTPAETPAAKPADLAETSWNCYEFAVGETPIPVLASAPITANFSTDGKMAGNAGVNNYNTSYKTDGNNITLGAQIATTMMAGPDDAMKQEADYLTTLPTAQTFNITDKGDLVLFGPAKNMIARYHPAK